MQEEYNAIEHELYSQSRQQNTQNARQHKDTRASEETNKPGTSAHHEPASE